MKIYSVSARYHTEHTCNIPSDSPECLKASKNNFEASDQLKAILNGLGLVNAHAYGWPDGSLYRYAEFDSTAEDLHNLITDQIPEEGRLSYIEYPPGDMGPGMPPGIEHTDFAIKYWADRYQEIVGRIERAREQGTNETP